MGCGELWMLVCRQSVRWRDNGCARAYIDMETMSVNESTVAGPACGLRSKNRGAEVLYWVTLGESSHL